MLYLEMLASREQIKEARRQVEHNRLEARLARNRPSTDAALRVALPHKSVFARPAGSIRGWQGVGW